MKTVSEEMGKQLQDLSVSIITTFGDEAGISRVRFDFEEDQPVALVGLIGRVDDLPAECKARIVEHASPYEVRFDFVGNVTTAV